MGKLIFLPTSTLWGCLLFFCYSCQLDTNRVQVSENGQAGGVTEGLSEEEKLKQRILGEFQISIALLPVITSESAQYLKDGLLYDENGKQPFTGRLQDLYPNGNLSLDATFLGGVPHGVHIKRYENGNTMWEALYDRGVLCGGMSKGYENGQIAQEEYWQDGVLLWRKYWDEAGRLIKEERTRYF